jgi:hypothetical protein
MSLVLPSVASAGILLMSCDAYVQVWAGLRLQASWVEFQA